MTSNTTNYSYTSNDFGYDLGLAYNFSEIGLMLGVDYKSEIEHKLDPTIYLNSPSEIGIGMSWQIFNTPHTFGIDYKKIDSSSLFASPSRESSLTKDQDVFAIGYIYTAKAWKARFGYKYVSDLYTFNDNVNDYVRGMLLPYVSTSHFTLGGSYMLNDKISADLAIVYATYDHTYSNKSVFLYLFFFENFKQSSFI
jgi:long-subunit fatty acid transport protein